MSTVCIIPARGGSKRLPGKNLRPLGGTPLVGHTMLAARDCGAFDRVVVSSDDKDVLALAESLGLTADRRPDALATDTAKAVEVVREYLGRSSEGHWDNVAMCLPTCPLRTAAHLASAMRTFMAGMAEVPCLVGVNAYDFPPQFALRLDAQSGTVAPVTPDAYKETRSQNVEPLYRPNGSLYVATVPAFQAQGGFFGDVMRAFVMDAVDSVDIDYEYQFLQAEAILRAAGTQGSNV